jgi:hypothetical protein
MINYRMNKIYLIRIRYKIILTNYLPGFIRVYQDQLSYK